MTKENKYPYIKCNQEMWERIYNELIQMGCPIHGEYNKADQGFSCLVSNFGYHRTDKLLIGFTLNLKYNNDKDSLRYEVFSEDEFISKIKELMKLPKPFIEYNSPLKEGEKVIFNANNVRLEGYVRHPMSKTYYIKFTHHDETCLTLFKDILKIEWGDRKKFVSDLDIEPRGGVFPEVSTLEDLETVLQAMQKRYNNLYNKNQVKPLKQTQGYEIRLQKTSPLISRGTVPEGSRICSRIHETAISIEPLSHTEITW